MRLITASSLLFAVEVPKGYSEYVQLKTIVYTVTVA